MPTKQSKKYCKCSKTFGRDYRYIIFSTKITVLDFGDSSHVNLLKVKLLKSNLPSLLRRCSYENEIVLSEIANYNSIIIGQKWKLCINFQYPLIKIIYNNILPYIYTVTSGRMEAAYTASYRSYSELADNHNPYIGNDIINEYIEEVNGKEKHRCNFYLPPLKYAKASLQTTVVCGTIFGLVATFLWWINLNTTPSCFGEWDDAPSKMHRIALISDAVKVVIMMFWPVLMIAPICSWAMIKASNMIYWCTIGGLIDIIDRLFLYVFEHYKAHYKSYVGNVIFSLMVFIIFYKFAKYRQEQSSNNDNPMIVTFKLSIQFIIGLALSLPYNYLFLTFYQQSTPIIRVILSCSLILVFYVPKLIIGNVITNLHGIYKPNEGIIFAAGYLINTTMVLRLTQAEIEELDYFAFVSIVHGIFNVIDKLIMPLRDKLCKCVCRRRNNQYNDSVLFTKQYIAHQSLISIITETTSVIMSNTAAYLLVYYYKREESTGRRPEGSILFRDMAKKLCIAVSIEWFFNIIALKIQNDRYDIPVLRLWKSEWKFIMIIHLIQIIYVVVYFADYVNIMLVDDVLRNSTTGCVGLFKRL